jgi:cytochrome c
VDSYEFNKIAGWVLTALIAVLGLSIVSGYLFPVNLPEKPAYVVQGVEVEAAGGGEAEVVQPIGVFLASANLEKGAAQFKKCAACHTVDKGGAQGIGPNLYGIVGAKHAHIAGFGYSDAMKATGDKVWDWEGLSAWLENPRKYIPGNKMAFAGIGKPQDRADLIAYMNSKSDSPQPLPAVAPTPSAEAAPAADAAPAEGAAPQAAEAAPTA